MSQGFTKGTPIDTDPTLSLNSDIVVPSQAAVVAYTASQVVGKQDAISLTTTGSSGASTFISNTLNVPDYTLSGLGGVPTTRTITINGTTQDLSANRSWTVSGTTYFTMYLGQTIGAGVTTYNIPVVGISNATNELARNTAMPAGNFTGGFIQTTSTQPASGSFVVTLRKNLANTAIAVTVAANSAAGQYPMSSSTVAANGTTDRFALQFTNNAAASSGILFIVTLAFT